MYGIVNKAIKGLIVEQYGIESWALLREYQTSTNGCLIEYIQTVFSVKIKISD